MLYNSTINCSFTGIWISSRLGSDSTLPLKFSRSISSQFGRILVAGELLGLLQNTQLPAAFPDRDLLAHTDFVGRNVHLAAVHMHMAVAHQLASLAARHPEAKAIDDVVEAALKLLQKHFASDALAAAAFSK